MFSQIESHIMLGYKCNHHCLHCVVQVKRELKSKEKDDTLSHEEAIATIEQAFEHKATKIVISGGEPTLRSDIIELVQICLKKGAIVQIQTNGSQTDVIKNICIENRDYSNMLEFMIPMHSVNENIFDMICGCKGGYENLECTLKYLKSIQANIVGKIVLTKYTDNLQSICEMYRKYGAKKIIIAYPHCVSFSTDKIAEIDLERIEVQNKINEILNIDKPNEICMQGFPRCFIGTNVFTIQEEDREYINTLVLEHQYKSSVPLPWHKYRKLDKRKFKHCSSCEYDKICEGIWKEYLKIYGD